MWPFSRRPRENPTPTVSVIIDWSDGRRGENIWSFEGEDAVDKAEKCFHLLTGLDPKRYYPKGKASYTARVDDEGHCFLNGKQVPPDTEP